jgi:hypothetical protein
MTFTTTHLDWIVKVKFMYITSIQLYAYKFIMIQSVLLQGACNIVNIGTQLALFYLCRCYFVVTLPRTVIGSSATWLPLSVAWFNTCTSTRVRKRVDPRSSERLQRALVAQLTNYILILSPLLYLNEYTRFQATQSPISHSATHTSQKTCYVLSHICVS